MEKNKIRAFVCVDFPDEVMKEIARLQGLLSTRKFTGKLTELENLHLTLKFLGEIDSEKLERVREGLRGIEIKEFEARLGGIGIFSRRGKPRIVWVKVLGKGMNELQKKVDEVLSECGFEEEVRFMSHLTVARVKYVKSARDFVEYIKNISVKGLKFDVGEFKLMSSDLRRMGPVYEVLEVYKLEESL